MNAISISSANSSISTGHVPSLPITTLATSYLFADLSAFFTTSPLESETSCSAEGPPTSSPTLSLFIVVTVFAYFCRNPGQSSFQNILSQSHDPNFRHRMGNIQSQLNLPWNPS